MGNYRRGFVMPFLLMLVTVLAMGGAYMYLYGQKQNPAVISPIVNTSTTTTSTSENMRDSTVSVPENWKTYTNKTYGYEFKYPSNWYLLSKQDGKSCLSSYPISSDCENGEILFDIANKKAGSDLMSAFKEHYIGYDYPCGGHAACGDLTQTTVHGYPTIKVANPGGEDPYGPGYFIQQDNTHVLDVWVLETAEMNTVDKVISSIRFF